MSTGPNRGAGSCRSVRVMAAVMLELSGGLVATPSLAHEIEAGAIVIVHPWARATGSLQKNGAVG